MKEEVELLVSADDLVLICRGTQAFTRGTFRHRGYFVVWRAEMGEPQHKEPKEHGEWGWVDERDMDGLAADDQLSAAAELMLKAYRRRESFLLRGGELGFDFMEDFEPLDEDIDVGRLFAEEGRPELPGEHELLSRVAKMYFD